MASETRSGGTERHPDDTEVRTEDTGDDGPPEHDFLAELEEATGHVLSDDLTLEATRLIDDEDDSWRKGHARS